MSRPLANLRWARAARGTRTAVRAVALVAASAACTPMAIELDPVYAERDALCADVACDALPRCDDGSSDCLACLCCACNEGSSRCDPEDPNQRWLCRDGCFVAEPCPGGAPCDDEGGPATCGFDCAAYHPYDLVSICGVNDALCAACGCASCDNSEPAVCDYRASGRPDWQLKCASAGCYFPAECSDGANCVLGGDSAGHCANDVDCSAVSCTGIAICNDGGASCAPCGCCDVEPGVDQFCGYGLPGGAGVIYRRHATQTCFEVMACPEGQVCVLDPYYKPLCSRGSGS